MYRKIRLCSLLIASCVLFVNGNLDNTSVGLIGDAKDSCMSKYNVTTYKVVWDLRKGKVPKSKEICSVHCTIVKLGIFNENSLNLIINQWLNKYFELSTNETELFQRFYVKSNEIRNEICTENNEIARDQKWSEWFEQQLPFFIHPSNGTDDVMIDSSVGRNITDKIKGIQNSFGDWDQGKNMFMRYVSNISIENVDKTPVHSQLIELIQDAGLACMAKFNVTGDTIMDFLKPRFPQTINVNDHFYTLYCTGLKLGIVGENGINGKVQNWIRGFLEVDMPPMDVDSMISMYQSSIGEFRNKYLEHIGQTEPLMNSITE